MAGKKTSKKTGTKANEENKPSFESAMSELEALVTTMESEDLSLEDSLKFFERGIALTRECQTALQKAEQTVKMLIEKNGKAELVDFADD